MKYQKIDKRITSSTENPNFDENQNFPVVPDTTVAPTKVTIGAGEYDDIMLPEGQFTSTNVAKRFYPGGFVAVVLVVFFFLAALMIFGT